MRTFLVLGIAAGIALGCGKNDDGGAAAANGPIKNGAYAEGDFVTYQVDREGYSLTQYLTEGKVTAVKGDDVAVEWKDLMPGTLALVDWEGDENPTIETRSYRGAPKANATKLSCDYEPEQVTTLQTPAGSFECTAYKRTCREPDKTYRISGCESTAVAITRDVTYAKEYLNEAGEVLRKFSWTLIQNHKG